MTDDLARVDLLRRKQTHFVLWRPGFPNPTLYIGNFESHGQDPFENFREILLQRSADFPDDLWEVSAQECELDDGEVYFYWFKVRDANPYDRTYRTLYCTDPTAWAVDRRLLAPAPSEPGGVASTLPASVVLYRNGRLIPCDPEGQTVDWSGDGSLDALPPNNRLVIYELPTRWARAGNEGTMEVGIGTFQDVLALVERAHRAPGFPAIAALKEERGHLLDLGVNALELLPPADSDDDLGWGYGTANFLAASYHLGRPYAQLAPTASVDLVNLVKTCHRNGLRFFVDAVTAFSRNDPYRSINFLDFHVKWNSGDPEQKNRDAFGGDLFKYDYLVEGYDPVSGARSQVFPARAFMTAYIAHWMVYYRIDGVRLDSVNNVDNYDFVQELKDFARAIWRERSGADDRFLVVGEELSEPSALLSQQRLDGLWNERFKRSVRSVILGNNADDEPSFEWTVRKLIDCRLLVDAEGAPIFVDGSQAVNYVTSHDVGGFRNERLYNFLVNNGVVDAEKRIKLAFVCLLTAVGVPMILAGEEFADPQDMDITQPGTGDTIKQIDPVDFGLLDDDWRRRIFDYVANLAHFRTTSDALALNDTQFIHGDFDEGKRVVVWQRGRGDGMVVVVANFSDYGTPDATPDNPSAEYRVPGWPATPPGKKWREITQSRDVSPEWVGREPIFPWEAKVYALSSGGAG